MTRGKSLLLILLLFAHSIAAAGPATRPADAAPARDRPVLAVCWYPTRSAYSVQAGQTFSVTVGSRFAGQMVDYLRRMPKGYRTIVVNGGLDNVLYTHPDDQLPGKKMSLWHPNGMQQSINMWAAYLKEIRRLGGPEILDYVALDGECAPSCYQGNYDPAALAADPRYAEAVRTGGFPATPPVGSPWPGADHFQFNYAAAQFSARETAYFGLLLREYFPYAAGRIT